MSNYEKNPLVHSNRQRANNPSAWVASFCCAKLRPLIICRGPIRKEVMDVLVEM
ncbi:MAG: hypothetical protein HKO07_06790, partial [Pseudomonadales bacterium]|nr:hypothetical protein [Pseudomonadales bacterium]